jgi:hypothetical protein
MLNLRPPAPWGAAVTGYNLRRPGMWYLIFFTMGAVLGSLATYLRCETKCRDCGVREHCEEFP